MPLELIEVMASALFIYVFDYMDTEFLLYHCFPVVSVALSDKLTDMFLPQVSSYGGFLTYQSKSFGIPSEGMTLMDRRPDVVLTVRGHMLLYSKATLIFSDKNTVYLSISLFLPRARV